MSTVPDTFKNWQINRRGRERIRLTSAYQFNADMLWDCLNWARTKVASGEMPQNVAVVAALGWFEKRMQAGAVQHKLTPDGRPIVDVGPDPNAPRPVVDLTELFT